MPRDDLTIKKENNEAYDQANSFWAPYITEADKDIEFDLGKQWTATEENYLKAQRREVRKFNKVRRINNLVSGYQRKNRLALKVDPVEGSDTKTADDISETLQYTMQYGNIYNTMSDAFRQGALVSGLNLVELYIDRNSDPASGDLRSKRMPHNRFLLDPAFTELDFSDCGYIVMRDWLNRDQATAILPKDQRKEVKLLTAHGQDNKFSNTMPFRNLKENGLLRYDRFYKQVYRPYTKLVDTKTGEQSEWLGTAARLKELLRMFEHLKTFSGMKRSVDLAIILEDVVMYNGPEPSEIDDYPFVPIIGFYTPEYHLGSQYKLQGITRDLRDPQSYENRAKSQMADIIESQITSGWKAKENSVVNPEVLYQSGQGKVAYLKKEAEMTDLEQIKANDIPQGLFMLAQEIGNDMLDVAGINLEMFGQTDNGDTQTSGVLNKLRTAAGIVVLQVLFDNYRHSKKILGNKAIKMIQKNFTASKIKRIIHKKPSPDFFKPEINKYDVIAVEGVLTDSQKQMNYIELKQLKADGFNIPQWSILEASNIQNKEELIKFMKQEEEAAKANAQMAQKVQELQIKLIESEISRNMSDVAQNKAGVMDKMGEVEASRAKAKLDTIKSLVELKEMGPNQILTMLERLQQIKINERMPMQ